jgi:hypothetical protein
MPCTFRSIAEVLVGPTLTEIPHLFSVHQLPAVARRRSVHQHG